MIDLDLYKNTTITERILKLTGMIHRLGWDHEGESTTDFLESEPEQLYFKSRQPSDVSRFEPSGSSFFCSVPPQAHAELDNVNPPADGEEDANTNKI